MLFLDEFDQAIEDLGRNFGVRGKILEDKTILLAREFGSIPVEIWKKACRQILEFDQRFPTIARIKEVLRSTSIVINGPDRPMVSCDKCEGTGFISTSKNCGTLRGLTNWCDYTFRCTCANGAALSKEIPVWNDRWRDKGHILRKEWEDIFDEERKDYPSIHPDFASSSYIASHKEEYEKFAEFLGVKVKTISNGPDKFIEQLEIIKQDYLNE